MREVFSRIGLGTWCGAHNLGAFLICAALIGRRTFLFAALAAAAAQIFRRAAPQNEDDLPELQPENECARVFTSVPVGFQQPREVALPSIPDVTPLRAALERVIIGQRCAVEAMMLGLIADGHILLEGAPGLGKTLACVTMARAIDATFGRIQCNGDLMPADITGCEIFDQRDLSFKTRLGPIFANVVLVDEINRAPARAQAALLEAMEDRKITIGTEGHKLPDPFFVLATMNEAETDGVFPLPAAQLDRFLLKVVLGFPDPAEDLAILENAARASGTSPQAAISQETVRAWRRAAGAIYCAPPLVQHIADLVRETRNAAARGELEWGAGPRAGLAILRTARARAILNRRAYVVPEDVAAVSFAALCHRVAFGDDYTLSRSDRENRLRTILDRVPAF